MNVERTSAVTYPRPVYVAMLTVTFAALEFTVAFTSDWRASLAYGAVVALAAVVLYQGERALVTGPTFVNAGVALVVGTITSLLFATGLAVYLLGAPWDLALRFMMLKMWRGMASVGVAFVSAFFLVAVWSAFR